MTENKVLFKNSMIMYARLIITTIIGLYASRVVLQELGTDGFGLFTVVGGLVVMLNMLNTTMISTSNRFLAIEIGKAVNSSINKVFNSLLVIHLAFSLVLVLIVELIGVWYVKNYLNIDAAKIQDALFILQVTTIGAVFNTLAIPYQGLITAHEKFNTRAVLEIAQSVLNLLSVSALVLFSDNKLRYYAFFVFVIQLIISVSYFLYCRIVFRKQTAWKFNVEKSDYVEITKFFTWQLVYVGGSVGSNQGGSLIMNHFFGTSLNAAFGVAQRVNEFIFSFVRNLNQVAVPQIMKDFSGGSQQRALQLIYSLSKYTFFIMLIPSIPIILTIDSVLEIWLTIVPPFTAIFIILRIVHGLISCLESGFDANIDASGKIRSTKLFFTVVFLLTLPVIYFIYKAGFAPYYISIVFIVAEVVFLLFQISVLLKITKFKLIDYWKLTLMPVLNVILVLSPLFFIDSFSKNHWTNLITLSMFSISVTCIVIYIVGLNRSEKSILNSNVIRYFHKFAKKNKS
jgi:O-antigen/teichoic acid export membrane protein